MRKHTYTTMLSELTTQYATLKYIRVGGWWADVVSRSVYMISLIYITSFTSGTKTKASVTREMCVRVRVWYCVMCRQTRNEKQKETGG